MILGDQSVGKTSLIKQFGKENKFDENEYKTTIGIDFITTKYKSKKGDEFSIKIWDTAGQERFKTLTTNFYRKADGIIVSFDVTDRKTFDGVATWMKAIKEHADASADVVLCGNKIDLANDRQVS